MESDPEEEIQVKIVVFDTIGLEDVEGPITVATPASTITAWVTALEH